MMTEAKIQEMIEYHIKAAQENGANASTYNYHVGAVTALKSVLQVA